MIRRWTVRLCLVVILLTLPLGAFSLLETSAVAETVVPSYGAPAYVDGSPVGGGSGYLNVIDPSEADYVVSTAAVLKSALASATSGQIVYVADGATITIDSDDDMYNDIHVADVKAGVTLAGGRGRSGITGGKIKISSSYRVYPDNPWFVYLAAGARLTGLTIEGPYSGTSTTVNRWAGVRCIGNDVEIDNNLIYNFSRIGVFAAPEDVTGTWVHHNYIHHCQMDGMGYGVEVSAGDIYHVASAIIEGNKFDYVRHAVCGGRGRSSWIFRYNSLGANCWGNNIDSHGNNDLIPPAMDGDEYIYCAGENIEVYNNTSLTTIDNFVYIRGTPYSTGSISVHNNWSYNTLTDRLCQHLADLSEYGYDATLDNQPTYPFVRMSVNDNWFGTTSPPGYSAPAVNQPPLTPAAPEGTASGQVGASYTYSAETTDPDGDNIAYHIHWGDGTSSTTDQLNSGVTGSANHAWTQAGTYAVTVRAMDSEGSASAWSPSLSVTISDTASVFSQPPLTPVTPAGTASGRVGTSYTYSVKTTDPDGDNIAYHIHWGDGTSSTTGQLNSGVTGSASHAWTQAGTYAVTVRATDSEGSLSAWSPSLTVVIASAFTASQTPVTPAAPEVQPEPPTPEPPAPVPTIPAPAVPAPATPGPAQGTSPAVIPTVEAPTESPTVGPSTARVENAPGSLSPAVGGSSAGGPQRSGFAWWLFSVCVIVGGAVLLTGAIVRDATSEPPGW